MGTTAQAATRHMVVGVQDLDELARLVERDTGKAPSRKVLGNYRSYFRRHGPDWLYQEGKRESSRESSRRWAAENREAYLEIKRQWKLQNPARKLWGQCAVSARRRALEFSLTVEDVEAMIAPMTCSATRLPLTWEHGSPSRSNPWAPSIDRIDVARGYVPGNVRVVCWAFNQARVDWPDEVVRTVAEAILRPLAVDPTRQADAWERVHHNLPSTHLLQQCRRNARIRGQECGVTAVDIEAMLAPMTCSATGLPLTWERGGSTVASPWVPSIDRLDCAKGYVPGNVRVVCWAFNRMRSDYPDEVVSTLARAIADAMGA